MFRLKKVDISSVALYSFLMFFILGLIFFLPFGLLLSILAGYITETGIPGQDFLPVFSGVFLIIIPIFYAILAMIINVIIALCYNLLSLKLGGIKINLEEIGQIETTIPENK